MVDDDEPLRTMTRTALELRGATVTDVSGVAEAQAERGPFDVALIDYTLEDGRGDRLAAWMRERKVAARIVLVSGAIDAPLEATGVDAMLQKPFAIDELVEVLEYVRSSAASREASRREAPSGRQRPRGR